MNKRETLRYPIDQKVAAEIAWQVKALAGLLAEHDPSKNHYQSVFNELYRRFGVSSYKLVPQVRYPAVLVFPGEWRERMAQ